MVGRRPTWTNEEVYENLFAYSFRVQFKQEIYDFFPLDDRVR